MDEFYDPKPGYAVPGPGSPSVVVHIDSGGSDTLTLTLCVDATAVLGNHTLTVQGESGKISHTKDFTLNVTTAPTKGGTASHGSASTFPGGIGRKIETTSGIFDGLSAQVTLPASDSQNSSIIRCNKDDHGDEAYIYSGGDAGDAVDFGLQLGHTGNDQWKSSILIHNGFPVNSQGQQIGRTTDDEPTLYGSSQIAFRFEAPGYHRQSDEQNIGAPIVVNGVVQPSYLILSINGKEIYWKDSKWGTDAANIKRCNTIAQSVPKDSKNIPKGDGPGKGFFITGTKLLGSAWNNILL